MKLLLDISDNKVSYFLEMIKSLPFIKKATPITDAKAELMQSIRESVDELHLVKSGQLKGIPAKDLF
ncbi:hypothetical protein OAB47_01550 [Vicingaceae bacterium]|jgi:hypothetical protein|nr:hypothetical protein [Vicingaceae bacterium]|tara:strand:+ start:17855 stop:18055 length:201 start_codon:yes stop_codon:yes gene_type:complete